MNVAAFQPPCCSLHWKCAVCENTTPKASQGSCTSALSFAVFGRQLQWKNCAGMNHLEKRILVHHNCHSTDDNDGVVVKMMISR